MESEDGYSAADILFSLRLADLGGLSPSWGKPTPDGDDDSPTVPIWPEATRGKRSRKTARMARLEAAAAAVTGDKGNRRPSPATPIDYSGGSGASTSCCGGREEGSSSPEERQLPLAAVSHGPTTASKVVFTEGQPCLLRFQPPRSSTPVQVRPRKKMRLPEMKDSVRSLTDENDMLRKTATELRTACEELSAENRELEARLEEQNESLGCACVPVVHQEKQRTKQSPDIMASPSLRCHESGFRLPDLNLPAMADFC